MTAATLDAEVRRDLRGLQRDTADSVARHLVAAGRLVDEDPRQALEHARFARSRASRIAVVREAAGIAAYHAGEWAEALGELRAARRMGGGPGHLAVMADIERALGRPERALELSRGPEVRSLERGEGIELAIVAAGARRDLGELDAAVVSLQIPELDAGRRDPWSARLFYAYADNLLAAGRESDALQWFVHAADADEDGETDADHRIAELTGEPLPEDDFAFGVEEQSDGATDTDASAAGAEPARSAEAAAAGRNGTAADSEAGDSAAAPDAGTAGSAAAHEGAMGSDAAGANVAGTGAADADAGPAGAEGADAGDGDADDADAEDAGAGPAGAEDAGPEDAEVAGAGPPGAEDAGAGDTGAEGADAGAAGAEGGAGAEDADAADARDDADAPGAGPTAEDHHEPADDAVERDR